MISVIVEDSIPNLCVAVVEAQGVRIAKSTSQIEEYCQRVVTSVLQHGMIGGESRTKAVRDLLRSGGYKPAGRGRPAQEYLRLAAEREKRLPSIYNAVDLINVVSLCSGLPVSLVALERLQPPIRIRYGQENESYVFNSAGQELDVKGLICLCGSASSFETDLVASASRPLGSPVKDSMEAKVRPEDTHVAAVIYGSTKTTNREELMHWSKELAQRFQSWCQAESVEFMAVP